MIKFGYIRVSTEDRRDNHSLSNQKEKLLFLGSPLVLTE